MRLRNKMEMSIRIGLLILVALLVIYVIKSGAFQFMAANVDDLIFLAGQHLKLVAISSLAAIFVAVPLGIFVTRPKFKRFEFITVNIANVGQTIPSIAILALVMSYLGIGWKTAVFALWFSSLLPILRNTIAGLNSVHPAILDAGKGMGMTQRQLLLKIEIPNALYAIIGGIRTAVVINVGTAALAF